MGTLNKTNMANSNLRDDHKYAYIDSATTTQVDTGNGRLVRVLITETAAGAITIADSASAATPVVALFKASIAEGDYEVGITYTTGLRVVTAGASKVTLVYEPNN